MKNFLKIFVLTTVLFLKVTSSSFAVSLPNFEYRVKEALQDIFQADVRIGKIEEHGDSITISNISIKHLNLFDTPFKISQITFSNFQDSAETFKAKKVIFSDIVAISNDDEITFFNHIEISDFSLPKMERADFSFANLHISEIEYENANRSQFLELTDLEIHNDLDKDGKLSGYSSITIPRFRYNFRTKNNQMFSLLPTDHIAGALFIPIQWDKENNNAAIKNARLTIDHIAKFYLNLNLKIDKNSRAKQYLIFDKNLSFFNAYLLNKASFRYVDQGFVRNGFAMIAKTPQAKAIAVQTVLAYSMAASNLLGSQLQKEVQKNLKAFLKNPKEFEIKLEPKAPVNFHDFLNKEKNLNLLAKLNIHIKTDG